MKTATLPAVTLILSDAHGVYIPRDFVCDDYNELAKEYCEAWHIRPGDAEILQNPEHEFYWGTWDDVLQYAYFEDAEGNRYTLHQDGDLWGLCVSRMTDEEKRNFGFDSDEAE